MAKSGLTTADWDAERHKAVLEKVRPFCGWEDVGKPLTGGGGL